MHLPITLILTLTTALALADTKPKDAHSPTSTETVCQNQQSKNVCNSRVSTQSCLEASEAACQDFASDGNGQQLDQVNNFSGFCEASATIGEAGDNPVLADRPKVRPTLAECRAVFQRITSDCVTPGENKEDAHRNSKDMRGWVNRDHTRCMATVDQGMPIYQLGSRNCQEHTGCSFGQTTS